MVSVDFSLGQAMEQMDLMPQLRRFVLAKAA
jgi:hypothetical protein